MHSVSLYSIVDGNCQGDICANQHRESQNRYRSIGMLGSTKTPCSYNRSTGYESRVRMGEYLNLIARAGDGNLSKYGHTKYRR